MTTTTAGRTRTQAPRRAPVPRAISVARWVVAALVALALVVPIGISAVGAKLLVVDGGSMSPTYLVGDVVVVTPPTGDDLVVGDVVMVGDDEHRYVHRVVAVGAGLATLKGDANDVADTAQVTQEQVDGVVAWHLGGAAGVAVAAAISVEGRIALVLVLVLLVLAPAWVRRVPDDIVEPTP
ncbi:MAG: signal peptidase I [Microbacterium sp.]|uniref:signal peptidase I n=1 Tax=Microbacterium sp. TaxID=51671 RepID=UPI0039E2B196